jgi:tetratricopeptide (TPR) repeat protein
VMELRDALHVSTRSDVAAAVAGAQIQLEQSEDDFARAVDAAKNNLAEIESRITLVLAEHQWLTMRHGHAVLEQMREMNSVAQAHDVAAVLDAENDRTDAVAALRRVVVDHLPGGANDYFNCVMQALQLNEPVLAVAIADLGLNSYPTYNDLVAAKAKSLAESGKPQEGLDVLRQFRAHHPDDFARGWRPVVYYADTLFDAGPVSHDDIEDLRNAFEQVLHRYTDVKAWSEYARMGARFGHYREAQAVLDRGLASSPFSQELNVIKGEFLMNEGLASDALPFFERALSVDWLDQFQHGVDQSAVRAHLAEAYEATDQPARAAPIYRHVASDSTAPHHIRRFAANRLNNLVLVAQSQMPSAQTLDDIGTLTGQAAEDGGSG